MRRTPSPVKVPMLAPLLIAAALAQEAAPAASTDAAVTPPTRPYLMEVGFRGRYLFFPNDILDIWYERHEGGEGAVPERPTVSAYTLGLEFVLKNDQANGIFYVEYLAPRMEPGYWDDADREPDTGDGSWIEPQKFGVVLIGANYGYELHATPWLSFLFGAGLGAGIVTGQMVEWVPGDPEDATMCGNDKPAYLRAEDPNCDYDNVLGVPKVVPVIDVNIGPRFNIKDRASIRLEGGLHALLPYAGGTIGIAF